MLYVVDYFNFDLRLKFSEGEEIPCFMFQVVFTFLFNFSTLSPFLCMFAVKTLRFVMSTNSNSDSKTYYYPEICLQEGLIPSGFLVAGMTKCSTKHLEIPCDQVMHLYKEEDYQRFH